MKGSACENVFEAPSMAAAGPARHHISRYLATNLSRHLVSSQYQDLSRQSHQDSSSQDNISRQSCLGMSISGYARQSHLVVRHDQWHSQCANPCVREGISARPGYLRHIRWTRSCHAESLASADLRVGHCLVVDRAAEAPSVKRRDQAHPPTSVGPGASSSPEPTCVGPCVTHEGICV